MRTYYVEREKIITGHHAEEEKFIKTLGMYLLYVRF